jgi:hypothetical protein
MFKFKEGDRVISTALPPNVSEPLHVVGTAGSIRSIDPRDEPDFVYYVDFDDGRTWWTGEDRLTFETPLYTVEEALSGIASILGN